MDDQVKIDGFRIELAEIENVFITHDLVDKAGMCITASYCNIKMVFMGPHLYFSKPMIHLSSTLTFQFIYYFLLIKYFFYPLYI